MRRKHIQSALMGLGLAALLTVGVGTWGVANAAPQDQAQSYTGQVREINGRHFSFGVPHHHRFGRPFGFHHHRFGRPFGFHHHRFGQPFGFHRNPKSFHTPFPHRHFSPRP
jgi:hypothetical protein